MKPPLPKMPTTQIRGDKKCNVCKSTYIREVIMDHGLYEHGMYWVKCKNCESTLVVKGEPKNETK